jgi:hypothetical protein
MRMRKPSVRSSMYVSRARAARFHQDPRLRLLGQGGVDGGEQDPEFTVHDLGVQALFRTEVLINNGLGDACRCRDLLDGGAVQAAQCEQAAPHVN